MGQVDRAAGCASCSRSCCRTWTSVPLIGPQIVTQGTDWYTALFHMSYYVLLALGLNVVVGYAGLLDLGYVGFFAVGTYTVALLTSPDSHAGHAQWAWLAAVPVAIGAGDAERSDPGLADAATARRLSGHRDARLRRDHPDLRRQPPASCAATAASRHPAPAGPPLGRQADLRRHRREAVLLARPLR